VVPVSLVSPVSPSSLPVLPASPPVDGSIRARRTQGIVSDLRDALAGTPDSRALTDELIEANLGVARSIAGRYRNRGIDLDDLEQVALLGLTKAAQRFDPGAGHDFLSYAVPTIRGEIRRHFRDSGWMVRPPRRIQDLQARIVAAHDEVERQLGRSPRPSDLATHLQEDVADVVEALAADGCFTPTSLDATVGDGSSTLGDQIGHEDRDLAHAEARIVIEPAVQHLSPRDRRIVHLRFFEGRTQQEIAEAVGLTQAQVSRVLARILADLRADLAGTSAA
jgi:RNA polymerase sigma-B factor